MTQNFSSSPTVKIFEKFAWIIWFLFNFRLIGCDFLWRILKKYEKFSIPNRASQKIKPFPAPLQQVESPGIGRGTWQIGKYQYFYHNLFHLFLSIVGVEEKLYCFLFAFSKLVFIQNHSFGFYLSQSVDERRILCFYMDRSPHDVGKSIFFWKEVLIMKKILSFRAYII